MRRHLGLVLLLVGAVGAGLATAQNASLYQQLTVGSTAVSLASGSRGSTVCRGTLETAQIRIAFDGSTPTATVGQPVNVNDEVVLMNYSDIVNFQAIATTSTAAKLNMTCTVGTKPDGSFVNRAPAVTTTVPVTANLVTPATLPLPPCNPVLTTNCQARGF